MSWLTIRTSGRMIMFGGRSGETDFLNDTWAYDPAANTWAELLQPTGSLPPARGQPAMAYDVANPTDDHVRRLW